MFLIASEAAEDRVSVGVTVSVIILVSISCNMLSPFGVNMDGYYQIRDSLSTQKKELAHNHTPNSASKTGCVTYLCIICVRRGGCYLPCLAGSACLSKFPVAQRSKISQVGFAAGRVKTG